MKKILIFLMLCISTIGNAISSEAIVMRTGNKQIVLINDVHVDQRTFLRGPAQKKSLLFNIQTMNQEAQTSQERPFLIVEDMLNYNGSNKQAQEYIDADSAEEAAYMSDLVQEEAYANLPAQSEDIVKVGSVITNLMHDAHNLHIDCYNAEVRQVKRLSKIGNFITCNDVAEDFEFTKQQIMNDLEEIKQDAEHDRVAKIVYDECTRTMNHCCAMAQDSLDILRNTEGSLKQANLHNNSQYNPLYDTGMVDARILIAWYHNRMKNNVIIIAGQAHIENVLKIFEQLDYVAQRYGVDFPFNQERNLQIVNNRMNFDQFFNDIRIARVEADQGYSETFATVAFNTIASLIS